MAGQAQDTSITPGSPVPHNISLEISRTGMNTTEVGAAIGVHERQVRRWTVEGHEPSWRYVVALARLFDREPAWFYVDRSEAPS